MYPSIKIIPIDPGIGRDLSPYDFTPEKTDNALEESYRATLKILGHK